MRWTGRFLVVLALLSLGCARGDWTTETLTLVDVTGTWEGPIRFGVGSGVGGYERTTRWVLQQTGQKVSHYIAGGGPFDRACRELMQSGFSVRYVELWSDEEARKKKAASKTKYTCPSCGLNAWGKPEINLVCGNCEERMEADEAEDEG